MKILSITPTFFPALGGLEQVVLELALRVKDHGVEMDVAHVAPGLSRGQESLQGINVHRLPLYGNRLIGWAPGLRALAGGYDLLHVHDPQLLAISANVRYGCGNKPAVLSTHGGFWHTNRGYLFKRFFELTMIRGVARHYRRVLASSVGDFDYFKCYVERISLCSNGVHVTQFNAVVCAGPRSPLRWIYWGRLSRNKRVDLTIDYAAHAHRCGFPVDLLICGQDFDGLLPELTAQVQRLGLGEFVHFRAYLTDAQLRDELSRRSVYVTASEHEGFGLSVVEAMAAGLVVVCRDMVPLNSFIEHGRSGWLQRFDASAGDLERLSGLLSAGPESMAALSAQARAAASVHDWELVVPRFLGHYRGALSLGPAVAEPSAI
ncbi:MAG: glycosyltransferase family 4 protein [Pseudomonadota bacterium]|nr:glycosyltransferase family 4 protein [Pseudomonadota bacterium]